MKVTRMWILNNNHAIKVRGKRQRCGFSCQQVNSASAHLVWENAVQADEGQCGGDVVQHCVVQPTGKQQLVQHGRQPGLSIRCLE